MNSASETDTIRELVAPSLRHAQVELVDLEWKPTKGAGLLRITIDRPGGVTLDDCQRVSTAVGAVLDAYDPIADRYQLEVSSPGEERPLRSLDEWTAAIGMRVNVRYASGDAEVVVEGRLLAVSPEHLEVEVRQRNRKTPHTLPYDAVIAGRIAVDI